MGVAKNKPIRLKVNLFFIIFSLMTCDPACL
jgi:hypothetical protein